MNEGMIDEHQARPKDDSSPNDYNPSGEDKKAIKKVEKLFAKSKKHRDSIHAENWLDHYHMFRGKQWKEDRPTYRHSEVINLIFRTIQSIVPIQTDIRPKFNFLPTEPRDRKFAEILTQIADNDWERNCWGETLLEIIYDANIYGTGISCLRWDPKAQDGMGGVVYETDDIFYIYPDPEAEDVNKKCRYFIRAKPQPVDKVKIEHPEKANYIRSDITDSILSEKNDLVNHRWRQPTEARVIEDGVHAKDYAEQNEVMVVECFITPEGCIADYNEEKVEEKDKDGKIIREYFKQKAKYPNGRYIKIANGVLLKDEHIEEPHREIPYQKLVNYMLPREFWGMGEVEQLAGPQRVFNKLVSFALDVLTLMGNPIWKVHTSNMIDIDLLVNQPGLVVEWEGEQEPKRETGVQLQPYVLQLIDRMAQWFDSISGANDVTRGVEPGGVTAARAIEGLQEAAQTRIRLKNRLVDSYLQRVGNQYRSLIMANYTAPRVIRLLNEDQAPQYFRVSIDTNEQGQQEATVTPYDDEGNESLDYMEKYVINGEFDTRVATGTDLPFAKAQKEQKSLELFDRGIIDEEEVLKTMKYPNYEAILERLKQRQQEAAQAQAQQSAG